MVMCMSFASVLLQAATERCRVHRILAYAINAFGALVGISIRCTRNNVIRVGLALSSLSV